MYSKTSAASRTIRKTSIEVRAGAPLRILEHDLEKHVAGVPAAIDRPFQQVVKLFQNEHVLRVDVAPVKVAQQPDHELVGVALDGLKPRVRVHDLLDVRSLAQLLDHDYDG